MTKRRPDDTYSLMTTMRERKNLRTNRSLLMGNKAGPRADDANTN